MINPEYQNEEALAQHVEGEHRAGLITINNPWLYCDWCTLAPNEKTTAEEYAEQCQNALQHYFLKANSKTKCVNDKDNGGMCVGECGAETGNHHIHLLVSHRKKTTFSKIREKFPNAHIDLLQGTIQEAKDYIYKQGRYDSKKPTQKCEPQSRGNYFEDNRTKGMTITEEVDLMLAQGYRPEDIMAISCKYSRFRNMIDNCYYARVERDIPIYKDVFVEWHVGESGSGKSYSTDLLAKQGYDEMMVEFDFELNAHPFDQYDPGKHKIVVIDDIRPGLIPPTLLLKLLDNRRLDLSARYVNKKKNWDKVIVTSVLGPEQVFKGKNEDDSEKQILRRINKYVYHIIDERFEDYEDPRRYKTFEMDAKDYENVSQLKTIAMNDFVNKVDQNIY